MVSVLIFIGNPTHGLSPYNTYAKKNIFFKIKPIYLSKLFLKKHNGCKILLKHAKMNILSKMDFILHCMTFNSIK